MFRTKAGIDPANSALPRNVTLTLPEGTATVRFEDAAFAVTLPGAASQTFTESR
ncbi:MAG TPA: hypothetical protein PKY01_06150 [Candidatus Hydrogenedentes bacterium]|nr:hypothetical protein [Candidatus Hydrogenedentota bacterium]HQH51987.1 hypothetical protein [Candidatus Hydrogenedentota bacterium]HQM50135.1 hypothetical protein [Candidatus Hydrogenedentota bacterium]